MGNLQELSTVSHNNNYIQFFQTLNIIFLVMLANKLFSSGVIFANGKEPASSVLSSGLSHNTLVLSDSRIVDDF